MLFYKEIGRLDYTACLAILSLMLIGAVVLASVTAGADSVYLLTPYVKKQLTAYGLGWGLFLFFSSLPYQKFKHWSFLIYLTVVLLLIATLFSTPIQNVHRWMRLPLLGISVQSSELAKLGLIVFVAHFLEKRGASVRRFSSALHLLVVVTLPFLLVAKQPDLGTALILFLIALTMGYVGSLHPPSVRCVSLCLSVFVLFVGLIYVGVLPHDKMKPYATFFLKEYQYERLNPNTYHQQASKTAIALGGIGGVGWKKSSFSSKQWLPEAHSDSVFAAYTEEFGLIGVIILLLLYLVLIYRTILTGLLARDRFGRLLVSGVAIYLIMHILVNIAMMCGLIPITGVPLIFITSGGTSILTTMIALGVVQNVYIRRFTFA